MKNALLAILLCLGALQASAKGPAALHYQAAKKIPLPGGQGWDYLTVDAAARRIYVSHQDEVLVLDADKLELVGRITGLKRCHGIATAPEFHRGFITDGEAGTVVVFDVATLQRIRTVKAAPDADGIQYDPSTKRVFTFNGDSGNSTVIDAQSLKVLSTLDLGGKPESAAVGNEGLLYDDLVDQDQVAVVDTKNLKVLHRWATFPGKSPAALAFDAVNRRLFVGCRNKTLVVMDSDNGKILKSLPIGDHVDAGAFDPKTLRAFTSNGDGTLTVVQETAPSRFRVLENVPTEEGARTMALDPPTGRVFTDTADTLPATPTPGAPKWRRRIVPGTFRLLVVAPTGK